MIAVAVILGLLFMVTQGAGKDVPVWVTLIAFSTAGSIVYGVLRLQARWLRR